MKKYDRKVAEELIERIESQLLLHKKNREPLGLSLKEINIVKAVNRNYSRTLKGDFNGHGYENLGKHLFPEHFIACRNGLRKLPLQIKKEKKPQTKEKRISSWAKRLSILTGYPLETCHGIAEEKIDAKLSQINRLEVRQSESYSSIRESMLNDIRRSNPLRRIKNESHAWAIIKAHDRHKHTEYEEQLLKAKEKAKHGIISYEEIRDEALKHTYKK